MSEIDTTKLALRGVGAVLVVSGIRLVTEVAVGYTLPGWFTTVLLIGLVVGYYQIE